MTISNVSNRTSVVGTAATGQIIPFTFPVTATGDLLVITRVIATGVEATLALTTDYAVTINNIAEGGWVTLVAAATTAKEIHIIRSTPQTQSLDLAAGGAFSAENIEAALDKAVKLAIESKDGIARCLKITATDGSAIVLTLPNAVDRAKRFLYFDADGNVTAVVLSATTLSSGAFGEAVLVTADEAAFKALANLEAGTDFNAYSAHLAALVTAAKTDGYFVVGDGTTFVTEAPATALTSLGVSAFVQTLLDDATAAAFRTTLGAVGVADTECYEGTVETWENEVSTWTA